MDELKGCPFCGSEPAIETPYDVCCSNSECECSYVVMTIGQWNRRAVDLERELAAMTAERDAARDLLRVKMLCDMPADYTAMVKRLEAERDALLSERGELRATVADYRMQLCRPHQCRQLKLAEDEIAKLKAENEWFPASEPPKEGYYLSINEDGTMHEDYFNGSWRSYGRTLLNITHYRKLPKPPMIEEVKP